MKRFEDIVEALETANLDLEQSLQRYEEGVHLYRYCHEQLQAVEKRIDVLHAQADGTFVAAPFVLRDEPTSPPGDSSPLA